MKNSVLFIIAVAVFGIGWLQIDKNALNKIEGWVQHTLSDSSSKPRPPISDGWVALGHLLRTHCAAEYLEPILSNGHTHEFWLKKTCPNEQSEIMQGDTYQYFIQKKLMVLECDGEKIWPKRIQYFNRDQEKVGEWVPTGFAFAKQTVVAMSYVERPVVKKFCEGGQENWISLQPANGCENQYLEPGVKIGNGVWFWLKTNCAETQVDSKSRKGQDIKWRSSLEHAYLSCTSEKYQDGYWEYYDEKGTSVFTETIRENEFNLPVTSRDLDDDDGELIGPDDPYRPVLNRYCR